MCTSSATCLPHCCGRNHNQGKHPERRQPNAQWSTAAHAAVRAASFSVRAALRCPADWCLARQGNRLVGTRQKWALPGPVSAARQGCMLVEHDGSSLHTGSSDCSKKRRASTGAATATNARQRHTARGVGVQVLTYPPFLTIRGWASLRDRQPTTRPSPSSVQEMRQTKRQHMKSCTASCTCRQTWKRPQPDSPGAGFWVLGNSQGGSAATPDGTIGMVA